MAAFNKAQKRPADGHKKTGNSKRPKQQQGRSNKNVDRATKIASSQIRNANHEKNMLFAASVNKLYNTIRSKTITDKERKAAVDELWDFLKGKVLEVSGRHDVSRTIQVCFQYGKPAQQDTIVSELAEKFVALSKGKYSAFLVTALLRHGSSAHRLAILKEFKNQFTRLSTHNVGARVVDFVVRMSDENVKVQSIQKQLKEEFYGQEYVLYIAGQSGTQGGFVERMQALEDAKKRATIVGNLGSIAKKQADKGLLRYGYTHTILSNYFAVCSNDELSNIIPLIRDAGIAMASSFDGASCMVKCIQHADAKERKKIVRIFKNHMHELSMHEFGHRIVLAALCSVDDTVLLYKSMLVELFEDAEKLHTVITDDAGHGRKVLLYVLAGASKKYFSATADLPMLTAKPVTSKKDPSVRLAELRAKIENDVCKFLANYLGEFVYDSFTSDIVCEAYACYPGNEMLIDGLVGLTETLDNAMETDGGDDDDDKSEKEDGKLMEHPVAHRVFKRCIIAGRGDAEEGAKDVDAPSLAKGLVATLNDDKVLEMANANRSAFVLLALLESPATAEAMKEKLLNARETLQKNESFAGVRLILTNLGLASAKKATADKKRKGGANNAKTPKKQRPVAATETPKAKTGPSPRRLRSSRKAAK